MGIWRKASVRIGYRLGRRDSSQKYQKIIADLTRDLKKERETTTKLGLEKLDLLRKTEETIIAQKNTHNERLQKVEQEKEQTISEFKEKYEKRIHELQTILKAAGDLLSRFHGFEYWIRTTITAHMQSQAILSGALRDKVTDLEDQYLELRKKIKKAGIEHRLITHEETERQD